MKYEVNKENTTVLETLLELKEPPLYQVVVHNDDFTPMEFVMGVLEKFFFMDRRRAATVMMEAHTKGQAAVGVFTRDYAESKIAQVIDYAKANEHPLICSMEAA